MSQPLVTVESTRLMAALGAYVHLSGRTMDDVIAKTTHDAAWALYRAFGQPLQADASGIVSAAVARNYAMRRRPSTLAPVAGNISRAAYFRALRLLQGQSSGYFRVIPGPDGVPMIRLARFSAKKTRRGAPGTLLRGGRRGFRFSASAKRFDELAEEQQAEALKAGGFVRMNAEALATAAEIGLRARAARGGTMRVQWLPRTYKRRQTSTVKSGVFEERNKAGYMLGRVTLSPGIATISAAVPGTDAAKFSPYIGQALEAVRADRVTYINRKLAEAKANARLA